MTGRSVKGRGSKLALYGCLVLFLFALACTEGPLDTRAANASAIRELDAQWSKTASANDLEGTVSYYSDGASLLPPNAPIATGKQSIRAVWASLLVPGASVSWQASKVEVARSGDLAYIVGTYQLAMKGPQGTPVNDHGKFVEVWKKQADGNWKVLAGIFNSDLPQTAPAEKTK
jgi:ketosteroid isomerase-like protein